MKFFGGLMKVTLADKLCVLPFVQQAIGICTIASNCVKAIWSSAVISTFSYSYQAY